MVLTRSRLIIPINVSKFTDSAYKRNADIIILDLEDSIPNNEKRAARKLIPSVVETATGGNRLFIRVNSERDLQEADIRASVCPEVDGIILPKVETKEDLLTAETQLDELDPSRRMKISVLIETAKGVSNMDTILSAGRRLESVSLGAEDLASELGLGNGSNREELIRHIQYQMLISAKANNIEPLALMGSISNYKDLNAVKEAATKAYQLGFVGNSCIHPDQVDILNKGFSPTEESIQRAKDLITAFEEAMNKGRASAVFEDKMIDYPHYKQAKTLLEYQQRIISFEVEKDKARKRWEEKLNEERST